MERPGPTEYRVLRETLAARGSLRHSLALAGLGLWALLLTVVLVWVPYPLGAVVPLFVLLATFEAIRPLHFGAERIGRYLQVFYEEDGQPDRALSETPSWERVAMSMGHVPGVGGHPLFVTLFFLATIFNTLPLLLASPMATPIELGALGVPHLAFLAWLAITDRAVRAQRAIELARFRELHNQSPRAQVES